MRTILIGLLLMAIGSIPGPAYAEVRNWGYQLQFEGPREAAIRHYASLPHDLLVIDHSPDGRRSDAWTRAEVARMAAGPRGRRVIAAYISIGETSDFRESPLWEPGWTDTGKAPGNLTKAAPAWLGPLNPDWPESRKVRYWDPDWQARIFNRARTGWLDTIVAQGFDAAYLDIVLGYFYWHEHEGLPVRRTARQMIEFMIAMATHARAVNPDFVVVPQNGAWIVADAGLADVQPGSADAHLRAAFFDAIGGIAVEDLFFRGPAPIDNRRNPDFGTIERLKQDFLCNGLPVFVVDYLRRPDLAAAFTAEALKNGFLPCAAPDRTLGAACPLVPLAPAKPDCG